MIGYRVAVAIRAPKEALHARDVGTLIRLIGDPVAVGIGTAIARWLAKAIGALIPAVGNSVAIPVLCHQFVGSREGQVAIVILSVGIDRSTDAIHIIGSREVNLGNELQIDARTQARPHPHTYRQDGGHGCALVFVLVFEDTSIELIVSVEGKIRPRAEGSNAHACTDKRRNSRLRPGHEPKAH